MFTVLLYTHNTLSPAFWRLTTTTLARAVDAAKMDGGEPPEVIVLANAPLPMPRLDWRLDCNAKGQRGLADCWDKIARGADMAKHPVVYLCEHDVLYPQTYFQSTPPVTPHGYWYNRHLWCLDQRGFYRSHRDYGRIVTSNMVADRELLRRTAHNRCDFLAKGGRLQWDEPGMMNRANGYPYDEPPMHRYSTMDPVLDIRLPGCLTGPRNAYDGVYYPALEPWGHAATILEAVK
jgi:hypothetical protein